jgi:Predicted Fe-S oxidoreductases
LERAQLLKQAGLNGAAISLDHHLEVEHNAFRGNEKSYYWVLEGIKNLQSVGILVSINVCPTRGFIESDGMSQLIDLVKKLDVPILNILEPRAVGNYQDKAVELLVAHKEHLQTLSNKFNFDKRYYEYPTVLYPAGFRKQIPCGGGKSYLLLDYDGSLYPCPFCKVKMPKVKSDVALCEAV